MRMQAGLALLFFSIMLSTASCTKDKYASAYCWICCTEQDNIVLHYINAHKLQVKVINICELCNFITPIRPDIFEHLHRDHHLLTELYKYYDAIVVPRIPEQKISRTQMKKYSGEIYDFLENTESADHSKQDKSDDDLSWIVNLEI